MKVHAFLIASGLLLFSCAGKSDREESPKDIDVPLVEAPSSSSSPIEFTQIDDNVKHDTLLIQTTFDLKDGTFLMVASHSLAEERLDEGDREAGLRLYHYRLQLDSTAEIISRSSSASDSWTMFPTFFNDPINEGSQIILANF